MELFLLIGQSNMAGRGAIEDQDRVPIAGVYALNKNLEWAPAVDPLHFDKPEIAGVGIGRSFARAVQAAARPGTAIGLIPAAFGGTSLEQWKPGGALYNDAVRRAKAAMGKGKLRGILWHQGEAESADERLAATYVVRFWGIMTRLRADLGAPDVPVIAGELGPFFKDRPNDGARFASTVNQQLALIPESVPHAAFVTAAGLTDKGDSVHFDSASLRELGKRYAEAFLKLEPGWSGQEK